VCTRRIHQPVGLPNYLPLTALDIKECSKAATLKYDWHRARQTNIITTKFCNQWHHLSIKYWWYQPIHAQEVLLLGRIWKITTYVHKRMVTATDAKSIL
jgi:hypothetical protein